MSAPAPPKLLTPVPPKPAEVIELRGSGWSATVPAVLITSAITALIMRLTAAPAVPADDSLRHDVRDLATEQRASAQDARELRAQQAQQEQSLNAVRADVAGLRAEVRELTRALSEKK